MYSIHDKKAASESVLGVYSNALAIARDLLSSLHLHDDISGGIHTDESVGLLKATKSQFPKNSCMHQEGTYRVLHAEKINIPCVYED